MSWHEVVLELSSFFWQVCNISAILQFEPPVIHGWVISDYNWKACFLIWVVHSLLRPVGLAVGHVVVIRPIQPTTLRRIISGPVNPQWKSKAGTQEMGVEWGHIPMRQHVLQVMKSQDTYLGIVGMCRILEEPIIGALQCVALNTAQLNRALHETGEVVD